MTHIIGFPGLGITLTINRVAFSAFGRDIFWYGILIAAGLLLAILFCSREGKRQGLASDTFSDLIIVAAPVAVVCARLYYVVFNARQYAGNLMGVFKIWEGGLAIYGAIIGGVLAAFVYCKVKRLDTPKIFDIGIFGLLIGQTIGRWGNFINAEAYGAVTSLPWRMQLYVAELGKTVGVHPTFLYESLWNAAGFIGLYLYRKKKKFDGMLFLLYVAWYGIGRAWIEGLRTDSLYLGGLRVSQLVAAVTAIIAVSAIAYRLGRNRQTV